MSVRLAPPLIAVCLLASGPALARKEDLVVGTQSGDVRGVVDGVQKAWLNIPFAAPPVGDLRWRPPQPPAKWKGIRDGSEFGPRCMQDWGYAEGSEDCLHLNVYAPVGAKANAKLPVMVYLFPGGDEYGDNQAQMKTFIERGVVLVVPNYRIGVFGFFAHPFLTTEGGGSTSPNYGMYDQAEALRWTRRNIRAFGGDPDNVTLFGGSAGAQNTMSQLANPQARGLFDRAIVASGYRSNRTLADLELWGKGVARNVGCTGDDVIACLRSKDFLTLAHGWYTTCDPQPSNCSFEPAIDGITLAAQASDYIREHGSVPLLLGHNSDEALSFLVFGWGIGGGIDAEAFVTLYSMQNYMPWYPPQTQTDILATLQLYPIPGQIQPEPLNPVYESELHAFADYMNDRTYTCNLRAIARGASDDDEGAVYRYYLTHEVQSDWMPYPGAPHMLQEDYLFGWIRDYSTDPAELTLADQMADYWTNFAKAGNPNGPGLPSWPRYRPNTEKYVELDTPIRVGSHLRDDECDLIDTVANLYYPIPESNFGPEPPQTVCGMNWITFEWTPCPMDGIEIAP